MQSTNSVYFDGCEECWDPAEYIGRNINNAKEYEAEYLPSMWKDISPEQQAAGHGGMDWFIYKAFVDCLRSGAPMPIDAYDGAVWQAVSVLSEASIAAGGVPQAMPDFTGGKWVKRTRLDVCEM